MECNIIKDLLPLYLDNCCSEESRNAVKEHLNCCEACRTVYEDMKQVVETKPVTFAPKKAQRINIWLASVLQSLLFLSAFALITVGVALEASTPTGLANGFWAFNLVIPSSGFLLSLVHWYFVRVYKSRAAFSNASLFIGLGLTVGAYLWGGFHYECSIFDFFGMLRHLNFIETVDWLKGLTLLFGLGLLLTAFFCALSKCLSVVYAKMLGKE